MRNYKLIRAEDYKSEPIQFVGYYVLHKTKDMPDPEVFFVEDTNEKEK